MSTLSSIVSLRHYSTIYLSTISLDVSLNNTIQIQINLNHTTPALDLIELCTMTTI